MENQTELLKTLLAAQVLTLAQSIAAEKRAKGQSSTGRYIDEAVSLIAQERSDVLRRLAGML
jgi:hypothetical protein